MWKPKQAQISSTRPHVNREEGLLPTVSHQLYQLKPGYGKRKTMKTPFSWIKGPVQQKVKSILIWIEFCARSNGIGPASHKGVVE